MIKSTNSKSKKKSSKSPGGTKSAKLNLKSENILTGLGEKKKSKKHHPPLLSDPFAGDIEAKIAERAHQLHEQRGRVHGYDWEDWLKAESQILGEHPRS